MKKKILIDWLTCTIGIKCFLRDFAFLGRFSEEPEDSIFNAAFYKDESILFSLKRFLSIPDDVEFISKPRPLYGYLTAFAVGGIYLAWGGTTDTIMLDCSGEGCRLLETLAPDMDWLTVIQKIHGFQRHNFSRLDVACDTVQELKMSNLFKYSLEKRYLSRWKSDPRVVQGREETIDFGSPRSRTMLRIYNKTLERQCKVDPDVEVPEGWVRLELQLRNDAVDSFVREWVSLADISAVYFGLMSNQLKFVKKRESNLDRSVTVKWWKDFLDNSEPIRLAYKGGLEYNLQSLERFLFGQAGSSMKTWLTLRGWSEEDMIKVKSDPFVDDDKDAELEKLIHKTVSTILQMAHGKKINERQKGLINETAAILIART